MLGFKQKVIDKLNIVQLSSLEKFLKLDLSYVCTKIHLLSNNDKANSINIKRVNKLEKDYKFFLFLNYCISSKDLVPKKSISLFWKLHFDNKTIYKKELSEIGLVNFNYFDYYSLKKIYFDEKIVNNKKNILLTFDLLTQDNTIIENIESKFREIIYTDFYEIFPKYEHKINSYMNIIGKICNTNLTSTKEIFSQENPDVDIDKITYYYKYFLLIIYIRNNFTDFKKCKLYPSIDVLNFWKIHSESNSYYKDCIFIYNKKLVFNNILDIYELIGKDFSGEEFDNEDLFINDKMFNVSEGFKKINNNSLNEIFASYKKTVLLSNVLLI